MYQSNMLSYCTQLKKNYLSKGNLKKIVASYISEELTGYIDIMGSNICNMDTTFSIFINIYGLFFDFVNKRPIVININNIY